MKVLVVDDEEYFVAYLKSMLSRQGYDVTTAISAAEAISLAQRGRFDLVVADLIMPKLSGWDLAGMLHDSSPGLPLVIMSGYSLNEIRNRGIDIPCKHISYWFKSSNVMDLIVVIKALVQPDNCPSLVVDP